MLASRRKKDVKKGVCVLKDGMMNFVKQAIFVCRENFNKCLTCLGVDLVKPYQFIMLFPGRITTPMNELAMFA